MTDFKTYFYDFFSTNSTPFHKAPSSEICKIIPQLKLPHRGDCLCAMHLRREIATINQHAREANFFYVHRKSLASDTMIQTSNKTHNEAFKVSFVHHHLLPLFQLVSDAAISFVIAIVLWSFWQPGDYDSRFGSAQRDL